MPQCQGYGCNNKPHLCKGKSFFQIPNGKKDPRLRDKCGKWLHFIGTGHTVDRFVFSRHKIVCEDHFTVDCFTEDQHIRMSKLLQQKPRYTKTLHDWAVPTVFVHRPPKENYGRGNRVQNREAKKLVKEIMDKINPEAASSHVISKPPSSQAMTARKRCYVVKKQKPTKRPRKSLLLPETVDAACQTDTIPEPTVYMKYTVLPPKITADAEMQFPEPTPSVNKQALKIDHTYCQVEAEQPQITPTTVLHQSGQEHVVSLHSNNLIPVLSDSESETDDDIETVRVDKADIPYELTTLQGVSEDEEGEEILSTNEQCHAYVTDEKYIVFASELDKLLWRVRCAECDLPVDHMEKTVIGSALSIKIFCINAHMFIWNTQPMIGRQPVGNLLMAGATLFTGETYIRFSQFAKLLNLKYISQPTYDRIQSTSLIPAINKAWDTEKHRVCAFMEDRQLAVCGDGRCDSPGFSAKYCSYTKPRAGSGAKGESRFRTRFSKATQQWIVEPVKEKRSTLFATELLSSILNERSHGHKLEKTPRPSHIPNNIAKVVRPNKTDLVSNHKT